MKPTMHLRFVDKDMMIPHPQILNFSYVKNISVLQQKWEETDPKTGEIKEVWKDVPKEKL